MSKIKRDWFATFLGVVVFLFGVGIVVWALTQAFSIFIQAPQNSLGIEKGKPLDFNMTGLRFAQLLLKILALILISGIGSTLANRGARMYSSGRLVMVQTKDEETPTS